MSSQFNGEEEVLARLVREAGDPSVAPDPRYAERLRAGILDRLGPAQAAVNEANAVRKTDVSSNNIPLERTRNMKRIARFIVAATILLAAGILVSWIVIGGGSNNIAFAEIAKALDGIRTATYDCTMEMKNPMDGTTNTISMKSFFLAPSRERVEMSMGSTEDSSVMILDHQEMKGLVLAPKQKLATAMDLSKIRKPAGTSNPFEMVRKLVQEGGNGEDEKIESLGKKEIDGRVLVGFRSRINMASQTFWADPRTARLVRIEVEFPNAGGRGVMSNFRYDTELAPSLFSLEPPSGYTVNTMEATMPTEDDLVNVLRLIARHNDGVFPPAMGNTKEYMNAIQAISMEEAAKFVKTPEGEDLAAKLKSQYGEDKNGYMKAWAEAMVPFNQKLMQKLTKGMMFYNILTPDNDSHYAGKGVKLDTSDRPILWYKPTGAENYHVIYADLSVKQMTPDEAKKLPQANAE